MSVQQLQSIEMYEVNDGEENVDCLQSDDLKPHFGSQKSEALQSTKHQTPTPQTIIESSGQLQTPISYDDWVGVDNIHGSQEAFDVIVQNLSEDEIFDLSHNPIQEPICTSYPEENNEIQSFTTNIVSNSTLETSSSKNQDLEKNDSKNVPKGMMKAFAHMILDKNPANVRILKEYFEKTGQNFEAYKARMKKIRKSSKISIKQIRDMLLDDEFGSIMRTLGCYFMRKRFLNHIFNSKMEKTHIHLKYIKKWMEILKNPKEFTSLK